MAPTGVLKILFYYKIFFEAKQKSGTQLIQFCISRFYLLQNCNLYLRVFPPPKYKSLIFKFLFFDARRGMKVALFP